MYIAEPILHSLKLSHTMNLLQQVSRCDTVDRFTTKMRSDLVSLQMMIEEHVRSQEEDNERILEDLTQQDSLDKVSLLLRNAFFIYCKRGYFRWGGGGEGGNFTKMFAKHFT